MRRIPFLALLILALSRAVLVGGSAAATSTISLSEDTIIPGQTITVSGNGFLANGLVAVFAAFTIGRSSQHVVATPATSAGGSFTTAFTVPGGVAPGSYTLTVTDYSGHSATHALTVLPVLSIHAGSPPPAPVAVLAGHDVALIGSGYRSGESVRVTASFPLYSGNSVAVTRSVSARSDGVVTAVLTLPNDAVVGTYGVVAAGLTSSSTASGKLQVVYRPFVYASVRSVAPGGSFHVLGGGFIPRSSLGIRLALPRTGAPAAALTNSATAGTTGSFVTSFSVPPSAALRADAVQAVDSAHGLSARTLITIAVHAAIRLTPNTVAPGKSVSVSGSAFGPNVRITVSTTIALAGGGFRTLTATASTGPAGNFAATLKIPTRSAAGNARVAAQAAHVSATALLRITG